jgi:hypothetical protein
MATPKRRIAFAMLLLLLAAVLAEVAMRIVFAVQGYTVGSLAPNWFPQVSEKQPPTLVNSYYTDGTALFRADRTFWHKEGIAVNTLGFLGPEWVQEANTKTKLFLIGDSFVWGAGAEPLSNSFASRLSLKGPYQIFNSGIPGADPAQYELVAKRFVPLLQPNFVIVFVYLGNDVMAEKRTPLPNKSLFYPTNLGWFPGYYQGRYFNNLEESYLYYLSQYSVNTLAAKIACKTAVGTAICALPKRIEERSSASTQLQSLVTNKHLNEIVALGGLMKSQFIIVPIPYSGTDFEDAYFENAPKYLLSKYEHVFSGLTNYISIAPLKPEHFHALPNGHLNNQGHQVMTDFLTEIVAAKNALQP